MSARQESIPWGGLMAAGLRMGLAPDAFWRTSLAEWRLLIAGAPGGEAMGRAQFEVLLRAFEDTEAGHGER